MTFAKYVMAHSPDRAIGSIPMAQDYDDYSCLYESSDYVPNPPSYGATYVAPAGRKTASTNTLPYNVVQNEPILEENTTRIIIAPVVATWQLDAVPVIGKGKIYITTDLNTSIVECFFSRLPLFNVIFDPNIGSSSASPVNCAEISYINGSMGTSFIFNVVFPVDHIVNNYFTATKCDTVKSGQMTIGPDTLTHYVPTNLVNGFVNTSMRVSGTDNFECTTSGIVKPIANDVIQGENVRFPAYIGNLAFRPRVGQVLAAQVSSNNGHVLPFYPTAIATSLKNNDTSYFSTLPYISVDNNLGEYGASLQKSATFLVRKLKRFSLSVKALEKTYPGCTTVSTQCIQHSTIRDYACTERYGISFSFRLFQCGNAYKLYYNFKAVSELLPVSRIHKSTPLNWQQSGTLCSGITQLYANAQAAVDALTRSTMSTIYALRSGTVTKASAFDAGIVDVDYNTEVAIDKSYTSGKQLHFRLKFSATGKIEYLNITLDDLTFDTDEHGRYKGQWL